MGEGGEGLWGYSYAARSTRVRHPRRLRPAEGPHVRRECKGRQDVTGPYAVKCRPADSDTTFYDPVHSGTDVAPPRDGLPIYCYPRRRSVAAGSWCWRPGGVVVDSGQITRAAGGTSVGSTVTTPRSGQSRHRLNARSLDKAPLEEERRARGRGAGVVVGRWVSGRWPMKSPKESAKSDRESCTNCT